MQNPNSLASNVLETIFEERPWSLSGRGIDGWRAGCQSGAEVPVQDVVVRGKVVTLAAALDAKKLGIRVDAEPTASTVVLLSEDGTITPLLSDEASRALFLDKRLQNRPAELRGKRFGGLPYFQVVTFKIEQDGKLQTPEYYCNICAISVRFPQVCPCCQGPMELRMKPGR